MVLQTAGNIIRQRGETFQVETNFNHKRERVTFKTRARAEAHAEQKKTEIRSIGVATFELTVPQRANAVEALSILEVA